MLLFLLVAALAASQPPVELAYTLRVDTADLSAITVELHIRNAPANLTLATHAHPEYDDKFWRYLEDLRATDDRDQTVTAARRDSVLWQLANAAGDVRVRYRVRIPSEPLPRAAWRPFLSRTGALVGGPHSFLYVLGAEEATTAVMYELPAGWKIATAYRNGADVFTLMESPMLVGNFSEWSFDVRGIPHRIAYWRKPDSTTDTLALVRDVERLVQQTLALFGSAPYRDYVFIYQDDAYGGLEHPNSVTMGTPTLDESAHEFVHTWNLMHFKPLEYRKLDYRVQQPVASLWFSEGLTIFYADLLLRRAGIILADSTRLAHLQSLIGRYLANPGNAHFSAEQVSRVAYNAGPGALGDYTASTHTQGEAIGVVLDLLIRDATDGARSMDDVMRLMNERFGGKRGFTGDDIERAVADVCGCSARGVFDAYVRSGNVIDFNAYLAPIGLRADITRAPALQPGGAPAKDLRIWVY